MALREAEEESNPRFRGVLWRTRGDFKEEAQPEAKGGLRLTSIVVTKSGVYNTYIEPASGVTQRSLDYWRKIRHKLGNVTLVICYKGERYPPSHNTIVWDDKGNTVLLSGFSCGYGGTGPHGLQKLLESEGFNVDFQREIAGVSLAIISEKREA